MRLKLDENLGNRIVRLFQAAGHDVATVAGQGLCSAADRQLLTVCVAERRCLVTLDLDFANPFLFRPRGAPGIAVLRVPPRGSAGELSTEAETLIRGLATSEITGRLWIVQRGRIRQYEPEED